MKTSESKEKLLVCVVLDYLDTRFSNLVIEYLCEKEKVCETVFACSYWAHVKFFEQKNCQNLMTLSL